MKGRRVSVGVLIAVFTLGAVALCSAQVTETAVGKKYVGTWVRADGGSGTLTIARGETGYELVGKETGNLDGLAMDGYERGGVLIVALGFTETFAILKDDRTLVFDGVEWKRKATP